MLSEEQTGQLAQETLIAAVESFDELPSTNDHAVSRSKQGNASLPLLVLAKSQTAGRGRGANTWWSSEGALTFSILFGKRHLSTTDQAAPMTSLAVGVAVCDAVKSLDGALNVGLKWPNDVYVSGKKLAGILIECPSAVVGDVVVGIGLNVNNSIRGAPDEIAACASSLTDLLNQDCDWFEVLRRTLHQIEYQITQMQVDPQRIIQRCHELCVLTGHSVELTMGDRRVAGTCQGIAASGGLLVHTGQETIECLAGQVDVRSPLR